MNFKRLLLVAGLALGLMVPALAQDEALTVTTNTNDDLGTFFVDAKGMTLYTFDYDTMNTSNCSGKCLENWPALTVESNDALKVSEDIPGTFGTITRDDGALQVTYNGWPLYYWVKDAAAGDTKGQGVGKVWWVAAPATVAVGGNEELGHFLVSDTGMTLYLFTKDTPGTSTCTDKCLENWPAYTVESADDLQNGANVGGTLGTITRDDGSLQVTYNDMPLYYWAKDAAMGDATGQGVGDVWWVVKPETVVTSSSDTIESFLTDANGYTLYTFTKDTAGVSNCADDCAKNWPPFTVASADSLVAGVGIEGELATIERADGKLQVTYKGMPLYYFASDALPGDTTGQGVGDVWFAALP